MERNGRGARVRGGRPRIFAVLTGSLALAALLSAPTVAGAIGQPSLVAGPDGSVTGPANATVIDTKVSAPITMAGQTSTRIESRWSAADAALTSDAIVRPEGWNLEYTTDGTNWTSTAPTPLSSAIGIRSTGAVNSQGLDSAGLQVSSKPSAGTTLPVSAPIQGGAGGDGYSLTFAGTRVLNVWHHQNISKITVDCHLRATGAQCDRVEITGSYANANNSPGGYHAPSQKFFTPVLNTATNEIGFVCADYSLATPAACATPFIAVSDAATTPAGLNTSNMGGASVDGDRFYVVNARDNRLLCLDMSTATKCAGFEPNGFATPIHPNGWPFGYGWNSDISAIDGKVYVLSGASFVCVDPSSSPIGWCGGNGPISIATYNDVPPFPVRDASGSVQMVCEFVTRTCLTPSGASATMPSTLSSFIGTSTLPMANNPYLLYSVFEWTEKENKLFWPTERGGVNDGGWSNDAACFDFTTAAPCAGGNVPGIRYDVSLTSGGASGRVYAFVADPDPDISCVWVNGDAGVISTFATDLGTCSGNTTIRFAYDEVVPRMSCTEPGRVREWRNLVLTLPNTISSSDVRVTIKDSAPTPQVVPGWNKAPISSTTIDLSALAVATTGTRPTFFLTLVNKTPQDATGLLADITYVSDAPQLCFRLAPLATCALGQPTAGRTPVAPFPVDATSTATGASTQSTPMSTTVTDALVDSTSCPTGDIGGTATERRSGSPVGGVPVRLLDPTTGTVLLTTTTAPDGTYAFTGLAAGTYRVEFDPIADHSLDGNGTSSVTVMTATTAQADVVLVKAEPAPPEVETTPPAIADPTDRATDPDATDAAPEPEGSSALPFTGSETLRLAVIAALAILCGSALALSSRRIRARGR